MNQLINWLFQQTTDGATYLQVIIVGLFLLIMINFVFKNIEDLMECMKDKPQRSEDNNERER